MAYMYMYMYMYMSYMYIMYMIHVHDVQEKTYIGIRQFNEMYFLRYV
jgi:hypothetical protein